MTKIYTVHIYHVASISDHYFCIFYAHRYTHRHTVPAKSNTRFAQQQKIQLLQTWVFEVLLYAAETWTTKKDDQRRLLAFEMRCYRQILKSTDRSGPHLWQWSQTTSAAGVDSDGHHTMWCSQDIQKARCTETTGGDLWLAHTVLADDRSEAGEADN